MNPMTNVKNIQKLNERMLDMGVADDVSWHKQYKDSAYVFIGGLPYDLTEGDILCVFSQYGEIVNINLVRDKKTGKQKGFCFLCYEDQRSTILAVDNFNGIKLGGRTIRVDHCADYRRPKSDEKDEDGKRKEIVEEGCAPKTPSPSPSEDEEYLEPVVKKKKKNKKEKKVKKDKERKDKKKEYSSESDSDQHQNVKKYSEKDQKRKDRNTSPAQEIRTAEDTYQKSRDNEDIRTDHSREWDRGKNIERTHARDSSPSKARKREYEESNRTQPRRREWNEDKRNTYESDRKRNNEAREYRSYDKNKSRYDREEHDKYNDYKRSRRDDGYDRERERNERKSNRR